ncbi:unnamed protein product, partial [Closterium sp. NIES-53]
MARVHHPNILRLEGYVVGATPILIYDYIPNGDAASYLAKARSGEVQFTWKDRLKVALGCAEALTAIHANGFVHRDFKAPNVLLREVSHAPHVLLREVSHAPHVLLREVSHAPHVLLREVSHAPHVLLREVSHAPHVLLREVSHAPHVLLREVHAAPG